jgi:GNAT superfamily N-acetyltransferase
MIEALETISRDCFHSFGVLPGAEIIDEDGTTGVVTGLPLTFFNGIGTTRLSARDADRRVGELIDRFRARQQSFRWWVTPAASPSNLEDILRAQGLLYVYDSAGMTADLATMPPIPRARITQVRDDADMNVFAEVLTTVFERPASDIPLWTNVYGACGYEEPSPWAHFLAWDGEVPAATASVLLCGSVCGIYLVGTLASARGRGLGSAATLAAMHHGRERGAAHAALQSSEMGERVYRSLGFVSHCMLPMFEWRYNAGHEHRPR